MLAATIALKANAAVLAVTALVGTMDAVTLGHALAHLYVPQRLAQLLLLPSAISTCSAANTPGCGRRCGSAASARG